MTKKPTKAKAIEMFVNMEIEERLLMLHRHSYIPLRLAKYRDIELKNRHSA